MWAVTLEAAREVATAGVKGAGRAAGCIAGSTAGINSGAPPLGRCEKAVGGCGKAHALPSQFDAFRRISTPHAAAAHTGGAAMAAAMGAAKVGDSGVGCRGACRHRWFLSCGGCRGQFIEARGTQAVHAGSLVSSWLAGMAEERTSAGVMGAVKGVAMVAGCRHNYHNDNFIWQPIRRQQPSWAVPKLWAGPGGQLSLTAVTLCTLRSRASRR
jgi:hypothetical protein